MANDHKERNSETFTSSVKCIKCGTYERRKDGCRCVECLRQFTEKRRAHEEQQELKSLGLV